MRLYVNVAAPRKQHDNSSGRIFLAGWEAFIFFFIKDLIDSALNHFGQYKKRKKGFNFDKWKGKCLNWWLKLNLHNLYNESSYCCLWKAITLFPNLVIHYMSIHQDLNTTFTNVEGVFMETKSNTVLYRLVSPKCPKWQLSSHLWRVFLNTSRKHNEDLWRNKQKPFSFSPCLMQPRSDTGSSPCGSKQCQGTVEVKSLNQHYFSLLLFYYSSLSHPSFHCFQPMWTPHHVWSVQHHAAFCTNAHKWSFFLNYKKRKKKTNEDKDILELDI